MKGMIHAYQKFQHRVSAADVPVGRLFCYDVDIQGQTGNSVVVNYYKAFLKVTSETAVSVDDGVAYAIPVFGGTWIVLPVGTKVTFET